MRSVACTLALTAHLVGALAGQAPSGAGTTGNSDCNQPMPEPIVHVKVPGGPWSAVATRDGCWIFVGIGGGGNNPSPLNGVAVLRRSGGIVTQVRFVPTPGKMGPLSLTHDGKLLLVPATARVALLSVEKLTSGDDDSVVMYLGEGADRLGGAGRVASSPDDRWMFVTERDTARISVFDLKEALSAQGATSVAKSRIPLAGNGDFTISPDGRYLYATSLRPPAPHTWGGTCLGTAWPNEYRRPGALLIIDVQKATLDPKSALLHAVPAGCGPGGISVSPDGSTVYLTAVEDGQLRAYDVRPVRNGSPPVLTFMTRVGQDASQSLVIDGGRRVMVVNFPPVALGRRGEHPPLKVVDAVTGMELTTIPTGSGPAGMSVTQDERTVLLANREGGTLQIVDLARVLPATKVAGDTDCNRPMAEPSVHIAVERPPHYAIASRDGCWIFLRSQEGVSVLRRRNGLIEPARPPVKLGGVSGMDLALTHDERMLIARAPGRLVFFDVGKLTSGPTDALIGFIESSRFSTQSMPGSGFVVTPDDRFLFVTNDQTSWLTVVDLEKVRATGPSDAAIVAGVRTAEFVTSLVLSPEGRRLYMSLGRAPADVETPNACLLKGVPDTGGVAPFRRGAIQVVDMTRLLAKLTDPFVSSFVTACEPVATAIAPDGKTLYVASMADDVLLAFDVTSERPKSAPTLLGTVRTMGTSPSDIVLANEGRTIIVSTRHDRDKAGAPTFLTVIDAARISEGAAAVRGTIRTRSRRIVDLSITADQRTLLVPNREANTLQIIDLERMPLEPVPVPQTNAAR